MPKNELHVDDIFDKALHSAPGVERDQYVAEACGDDDEAKQRVEQLLRAVAEAGSFLESPAQDPSPTIGQPITEKSGPILSPGRSLIWRDGIVSAISAGGCSRKLLSWS